MKVRVEELISGCILQKDIMGKTNHPIFLKNTVITEKHVEFMKAFLIKEIDIEHKHNSGNTSNEKSNNENNGERSNSNASLSNLYIYDYYMEAVHQFKKEFEAWRSGVTITISNVRSILLPLFEKMEGEREWIRHIHQYSNKEDYHYHHSIAVSMIATYIAKEMGYDRGQSLQIGLASCLADCGMAKINPRLLSKTSPLTDYEWNEIKKHPIYSYQMVKDISLLKTELKLAILQHHERLDGSGYPRGEKGKRVHEFSQIIAVADIYHAMTVERMYKKMQSPFRTLQEMKEDEFGKLDISILRVLINAIASLPMGTMVKLSNDQIGEVIFSKQDVLTRPLIKVTNTNEMVDLEKERGIYIESVLT